MQATLPESQDQGKAGQDDEREGHDPGHAMGLVVAVAVGRVFLFLVGGVSVAALHLLVILLPGRVVIGPGKEHDKDHPEGVIGGQEGAEEAQPHPQLVVQGPELAQDGLLAEEAGEREDARTGPGRRWSR